MPEKKTHPGSANLIPNDKRTPKERRENAKKAGRASGEKRRYNRSMKEGLKLLMNMKPSDEVAVAFSEQLGIPLDQMKTNAMVANAALMGQIYQGNVKAYQMAQELINGKDSQADKEALKIKKAELKIKQEQHDIEMEEWKARKEGKREVYNGIPALAIAPPFLGPLFDITAHEHTEYVFEGGRGSTKSSFVSIAIIDLIMKNETLNALVMRKVSNTINGSVYNQLVWAIDYLGLTNDFKCTRNPAEITRIATKQTIFFRGADDPGKVKSIKPVFGYIGIIWFEELDQFSGEEEIRKIEQSAMRGGDLAWIFKSFNPPKSAINWANKYIKIPKANRLVSHTDYRTVPKQWLGKDWLEEADFLKEINPEAYEHEYLGIPNGNGGNVFDNCEIKEITDEEIKQFDRIYNGIDWGWYPDPFDYVRCHYDAARLTLYIFDEYRCNKRSNRETAEEVLKRIGDGEIVTCDSAEEKSVADYRTYGVAARGAEKGPGSVDYSMKWLASLRKIIIDPVRCPDAAKEFIDYEYERDKEGNVISGYPDKNNHSIDAVRYAMNSVWKHRGQ
ncbi:MAG: PBSX family phage terminase large subunit [Erysipelotrichaceae bacterium]|nr:PBSX family phage terminase large subunit [Erysipelotrichaceae bacterium]